MQKYPKRLMIYLDDETLGIIDSLVEKYKVGRSASVRIFLNENAKSKEVNP